MNYKIFKTTGLIFVVILAFGLYPKTFFAQLRSASAPPPPSSGKVNFNPLVPAVNSPPVTSGVVQTTVRYNVAVSEQGMVQPPGFIYGYTGLKISGSSYIQTSSGVNASSYSTVAQANGRGFLTGRNQFASNSLVKAGESAGFNLRLTSPMTSDGLIANENGQVLTSATLTCRGGAVVTTLTPMMSRDSNNNAVADLNIPNTDTLHNTGESLSSSCNITLNYEDPSSLVDNSSLPPSASFAGLFTISPVFRSIVPGQGADYTVTFKPMNGWSGNVTFKYVSGCTDGTTCFFGSGGTTVDMGFVDIGGTLQKDFHVANTLNMPLGQTMTFNLTANDLLSAKASLIANKFNIACNNHAKFGGWAEAAFISKNGPHTTPYFQPMATTLNPGETGTVSFTMINDGCAPWVGNSQGPTATEYTTPASDGYAIHTTTPSDNTLWNLSRIPIDPQIPSTGFRFLKIKAYARSSNSFPPTYYAAPVNEVSVYNTSGNKRAVANSTVDSERPCTFDPMSGITTCYTKNYAYDSNNNSYWQSSNSITAMSGEAPGTMVLDFGSSQPTSYVSFRVPSPGMYTSYTYQLFYSNDNVNYYPLNNVVFGTGMANGLTPSPYDKILSGFIPASPVATPVVGLYVSGSEAFKLNEIHFYDYFGNELSPIGAHSFDWTGRDIYEADPAGAVQQFVDGDTGTGQQLIPGGNNVNANLFFDFGSPVVIAGYMIDATGPSASSNDFVSLQALNVATVDPGQQAANFGMPIIRSYGSSASMLMPMNQWLQVFGNAYGGSYFFSFDITAPNVGGVYPFQWKMRQEPLLAAGDFNDPTPMVWITVPGDQACTIDNFTVNDSHSPVVNQGELLNFAWSVTNADSVTATGSWSGAKANPTGTEDRTADTATTGIKTYTLSCTKGTATVSQTITVNVNPAPLCDPSLVGINQFVGCVYNWGGNLANLTYPPNSTYSDPANPTDKFYLHSKAPNKPAAPMSDPVPSATPINDNFTSGLNGLTDNYVVQWRARVHLPAGNYVFTIDSNDGSALYLDEVTQMVPTNLINDYWSDHNSGTLSSVLVNNMYDGYYNLMYSYYQHSGPASAYLSWSTYPPPPTNVTVSSNTCSVITVSWTEPIPGLTYNVYRNTVNNSGTASKVGINVSGSSFSDTVSGGPFYYWVESASGGTGNGNLVAAASNATGGFYPDPCTPTGGGSCNSRNNCPAGSGGGPSSPPAGGGVFSGGGSPLCSNVRLQWNDGSNNESGFRIYKSASNNFAGATALGSTIVSTTVAGTGQTYGIDLNLGSDDAIYYYWVTAFTASGAESLPLAFPSIATYTCAAHLSPASDKEIIAINGSNLPHTDCNGTSSIMPTYVSAKLGDILSYTINICNNNGLAEASQIYVSDTFTNLKNISNVCYEANSNGCQPSEWLHPMNPITSCPPSLGSYCISGTAPAQTVYFNIKRAQDNVPVGNTKRITYDAELSVPDGFTGSRGYFMNAVSINYYNGLDFASDNFFMPLQPFAVGSGFPEIIEKP